MGDERDQRMWTGRRDLLFSDRPLATDHFFSVIRKAMQCIETGAARSKNKPQDQGPSFTSNFFVFSCASESFPFSSIEAPEREPHD